MTRFQEVKRNISQRVGQLEANYIQRALDPERCEENKRYLNVVNRLIYFFDTPTSRGELERTGTSLQLSPPFTLDRTTSETGTVFSISRGHESGPENLLPADTFEQSEVRRENSLMEITYSTDGSLASIIHYPVEGEPVIIKRSKEKQWQVTGFTAATIGGIGKAKQRYATEQRELLTFWDEYYDSFVLSGAEGTDPEQALHNYEVFKAQREAEKMDRFGGHMSRRDFLRTVGVVSFAALLLAACQGQGGNSTAYIEASIKAEHQELVDAGVYNAPLMEEVEKAEYSNLSPGAKEVLYTYLASKTAADVLSSKWQKVATPAFLRERGVLTGTDLSQVFEFKNANGGVRYFDKVSNRYIKLSPAGSIDARYLQLAYQDTLQGWRAIGLPEELLAQVQWTEGFTVDGKPYVMMVTPNVGNNLEGYVNMLKHNVKNGVGEQKALALLDQYYTKVLFPMNASGVIQQDLNFKNITVLQQADGSVRLVPIDLAAHPKILEEKMVFQWQYEQLVARAARRNIAMPSFAEYLQAHPDIAQKVTLFEALAQDGIFKTSIDIGNQSIHLYLPKNVVVGQAVDRAFVDSIVAQMKQTYGAQYEAMAQGEVFTVEVTLPDGSKKPIAFMKTNAVGGKIRPLGGKWGEALKLAKTGMKLASDALLLLWIATEVAEFTDPDYKAYIESTVAFPNTAISTGRDNGIVFLDAMYDRLMLSKQNISARSVNLAQWSRVVEEMTGMKNTDALSLITDYGVPHPHIIQYVDTAIKQAVVPPAPSDMRFQSPFPILIPGAEIPTTAYFSVFEGEGKEKTIFFWAQVKNNDGSVSTMPVSAFTKAQGAKDWAITPIIDTPWSIQFSLNEELGLTYVCGTASSNGSEFELKCENPR